MIVNPDANFGALTAINAPKQGRGDILERFLKNRWLPKGLEGEEATTRAALHFEAARGRTAGRVPYFLESGRYPGCTRSLEMSKKKDVPVTREASDAPALHETGTWGGLTNLREEIDRLFDTFEPRDWFTRRPLAVPLIRSAVALSPAVDLCETDGGYEMTAELPGLDAENVEVKLSNGMLTVRGEKHEEEKSEGKNFHLSERRWGSFQRTIRIPRDVDRDKIEASFAKGVLTIKLPKSAEAKASEKVIKIKAA
ncbi:Hsp20/alpha crystallin family protein [Aliiruegeria lutimaris]|uniref:Hsp20/alpha crystallin family protein n=1 Tax=Aliiruegeria lutimaris TaxID=571298 RepID=A0A1G8QQE8_9RHOB|nr:Hsp20/alpha crystallin family protein [Aliiruegeria lutimaris]SDJ06984.1 Hsp20/alpha crystallin family protein [Aliiruegeria lutimaris]